MPLPFLDAAEELMVTALGTQLSPGVADYLDLFCQDGVLETPYVSPGGPSRWEGQAIAAYLGRLSGVIRLADFSLVAAYAAQMAPRPCWSMTARSIWSRAAPNSASATSLS